MTNNYSTFQKKSREIIDEFRTVVLKQRGYLIDILLPPLVFLIVNASFGFTIAMWGALGLALIFSIYRLIRRNPIRSALGGIGIVLIAIALVRFTGRNEFFFLPNILGGLVTLLLALISIFIKKPMVAWTSFIARRWPWSWYCHPRVIPAYIEVTYLWAAYFAMRTTIQYIYFREMEIEIMATLQVITGWPGTIALLIASYLYGNWRLQHLKGPSVEEFIAEAPPPWKSQQRGF